MKFSVLMSLYIKENPDFLNAALRSIYRSSLLPDEIVMVLDGPITVDHRKVIDKYPQLKIVALEENVGLGRALNIGLKHCTNELVARMDTDDICKPERFYKQIEVFRNNSNIDVCGAWIDEFENDISNVKTTRKLPENHDDIRRFAKSRNPISHPVVMFKKTAVINAGGYLHFALFEDYYLWVRMILNGAVFYNIQDSLLYFRFSQDMFKRRGGLKYIKSEFRFLKMMRQSGFINNLTFLKNIFIRFTTRIMPNNLRAFVYKKILRS